MNDEEKKWCIQLTQSCELQKDRDFEDYTEAISLLSKSNNPEVLKHMLGCFRDNDAGEIQYELVDACESFPSSIYVETFVAEGKPFFQKSPNWFGLMLQSILNTDGYKDIAISAIQKLRQDDKNFFMKYIENLSIHTPKYEEVLKKLKA